MNSTKTVFLVFIAVVMVSCEKTADMSNSIEYSRSGVHFSIPGNWIVTEDEDNNDFRNIFDPLLPFRVLVILPSTDQKADILHEGRGGNRLP